MGDVQVACHSAILQAGMWRGADIKYGAVKRENMVFFLF